MSLTEVFLQDRRVTAPSRVLLYGNAIVYLTLIAVNLLIGRGWIGRSNAEISHDYDTPLTPADYTFAVWGPIFLLQGVGIVYHLLPHGYGTNGVKEQVVKTIGYGWQLGWYAEIAWQFLFALEKPWAFCVSCVFLFAATMAFWTTSVRLRRMDVVPSRLDFASFVVPTSMNAAWLLVATSVAYLIPPVAFHLKTFDLPLAATGCIAQATVVGVTMVAGAGDMTFGLTLVWALVGVMNKKHVTDLVKGGAIVGIGVLVSVTVLMVVKKMQHRVWGTCRDVESASDGQPVTEGY